eukprot:TRINITY_DN14282_c0_g1_i1.p1 TRINITY_DN14282_c0_g1~~TRINITY_DN14282_c0_g1_i1.p1  ORF type:complete len:116 (-),score=14.87 TRINITY_DN14282_c0_g1_i1:137-463(-)
MADGAGPAASVLLATSKLIRRDCQPVIDTFVECKQGQKTEMGQKPDIYACQEAANAVHTATLAVIKQAQDACPSQLAAFSKCLQKNTMEFEHCRKEQEQFERCTKLWP